MSTVATPPRVASRMQRRPGPAASSRASAAGHSERVSDSISASSPSSPRASMIAVPCSPIVPETSTRSPGWSDAGDSARARVDPADPGRADVHARRSWPRSTTLVSPVTISTPAAVAAAAIASTSARRTSAGRPSSRTSETLIASGSAPAAARSLTVPLTASSPIEPPGNRIGLTTNVSVVIASPTPSTTTVPASASSSQGSGAERRHEQRPRSASGSPCPRRRAPSSPARP